MQIRGASRFRRWQAQLSHTDVIKDNNSGYRILYEYGLKMDVFILSSKIAHRDIYCENPRQDSQYMIV